MLRTANPALNTNTFASFRENLGARAREERKVMTVQGAVNRTGFLLILAAASAAFTWTLFLQGGAVLPWMIGGVLGGLVFALITIFKKQWAPITAPVYALAEGLFLGGLSAFFEQLYPGIALQAVGLTFGVLFLMLALYTTRVIKVTKRFMMGIVAATGAVAVVYLMTWILGMFGVAVPYIHGNGLIGIGFSLVVVVIAALNLVLDFHLIEEGAKARAPKWMEWYGAFGLMVTLVWLYLEMLRLLAKLNSRN